MPKRNNNVRIQEYNIPAKKLTYTILQTGIGGINTDFDSEAIGSNTFRDLKNCALTQMGNIRPRTGYKLVNTIDFIPDNDIINFDKTNIQAIIPFYENNNLITFYLVDGRLFDKLGTDITKTIDIVVLQNFLNNNQPTKLPTDYDLTQGYYAYGGKIENPIAKIIPNEANEGGIYGLNKNKSCDYTIVNENIYIPIEAICIKQETNQPPFQLNQISGFILAYITNKNNVATQTGWVILTPYTPTFNQITNIGFNILTPSIYDISYVLSEQQNENMLNLLLNYFLMDSTGDEMNGSSGDDNTNAHITGLSFFPLEPIKISNSSLLKLPNDTNINVPKVSISYAETYNYNTLKDSSNILDTLNKGGLIFQATVKQDISPIFLLENAYNYYVNMSYWTNNVQVRPGYPAPSLPNNETYWELLIKQRNYAWNNYGNYNIPIPAFAYNELNDTAGAWKQDYVQYVPLINDNSYGYFFGFLVKEENPQWLFNNNEDIIIGTKGDANENPFNIGVGYDFTITYSKTIFNTNSNSDLTFEETYPITNLENNPIDFANIPYNQNPPIYNWSVDFLTNQVASPINSRDTINDWIILKKNIGNSIQNQFQVLFPKDFNKKVRFTINSTNFRNAVESAFAYWRRHNTFTLEIIRKFQYIENNFEIPENNWEKPTTQYKFDLLGILTIFFQQIIKEIGFGINEIKLSENFEFIFNLDLIMGINGYSKNLLNEAHNQPNPYVRYVINTSYFAISNIELETKGTIINNYSIQDIPETNLIYLKANINTSDDKGTANGLSFYTIDNTTNKVPPNPLTEGNYLTFFYFPWENSNDFWSYPNLWLDKNDSPNDRDKDTLRPILPNFNNWIAIPNEDNKYSTNNATVKKFYPLHPQFLLGARLAVVKGTGDSQTIESSNYWKLVDLTLQTQDFLIDIRELASTQRSSNIKNRLFLYQGNQNQRVYWSEESNINYFPSDNYADVSLSKGEQIIDIQPFRNSNLLWATNSIHILVGDSPANWSFQYVNAPYGLWNSDASVNIKNNVYFPSQTSFNVLTSSAITTDVGVAVNIDDIGIPIRLGILLPLLNRNLETQFLGVSTQSVVYWFVNTNQSRTPICLKHYPDYGSIWTYDESEVFRNIKKVWVEDNLVNFIRINPTTSKLEYYRQTQLNENQFVDGVINDNENEYKYEIIIESKEDSFSTPLNIKKYKNLQIKSEVPSITNPLTQKSIFNITDIDFKFQVYVDNKELTNRTNYNFAKQEIEDNDNIVSFNAGAFLDNTARVKHSKMGDSQRIVRDLKLLNARGRTIKYKLTLDKVNYFEISAISFTYIMKKAKSRSSEKIYI